MHLRIDRGDKRPLWQKNTILRTKAGIDMHQISTEREYLSLSIEITYGGRQ